MLTMTKTDIKQRHAALLQGYLARSGMTQEEFARLVGCKQGNVGHWLAGRQRISPDRAAQIEAVTHGGIKRVDLYPDLFN